MSLQKEVDFSSIEEAIEDIKNGKVLIVVDDEDRENEGDFICAAELITPEIVNFMARYGRGLICAPLLESRAKALDLQMMVPQNTALHETAFTVSIDYLGKGCTTGISAHDRYTVLKSLTDETTKSTDLSRPGHIFPLVAKDGGVLRRSGHTEAAVDLARLAGLYPTGVLIEILNEDGSMARLPQLKLIAKEHGLKLISIKDLIAYRLKTERIVEKTSEEVISTRFGDFTLHVYKQITTGALHYAFVKGSLTEAEPTLVKVYSNKESNDILQLFFNNKLSYISKSLEFIANEGKGVFLYMCHQHEESSVLDQIRSFELEKSKEINSDEQKDFGVGAQILQDLGIHDIKLISRNLKKRVGIKSFGLTIVENVEL